MIGDMVMERLRQLDGVAYIRFASVYRAFADIEEMREEADAYARLQPLRDATPQLPLFSEGELNVIGGGSGSVGRAKKDPRETAG